MKMKHEELTEQLIKIFYKVYNTLGYGFLEKVYVNAYLIELQQQGIPAQSQVPIKVFYEGNIVGEYFADIIVKDHVIIEFKAAKTLMDEHEAQLLNYLRATTIEVGLLINFGAKPQVRRKIFDNEKKTAR